MPDMTLEDMMDAADAETLNDAGNAFSDRGMWNQALECYRRSRSLYQQRGDRRGEAMVLNNLGATYYAMGDWDSALACYEESLAIAHSIDDRPTALHVAMNIAFLTYAQGIPDQRMVEHARRLAEEMGDHEPLVKLSWLAGDLAFMQPSTYATAFADYSEALRHARQVNEEAIGSTLSYIEEQGRRLAEQGDELAALAFIGYLLENIGEDDDLRRRLLAIRDRIISPPRLG